MLRGNGSPDCASENQAICLKHSDVPLRDSGEANFARPSSAQSTITHYAQSFRLRRRLCRVMRDRSGRKRVRGTTFKVHRDGWSDAEQTATDSG